MNYEEKKEILREAARIATKVINERLPGNMFIPSITLRKAIDKEVDRPWHEVWDEQTREKWGITPNSFQRDWDSKKAQELHDEREREKYELYKAQQKEISNLESYFHGPQFKTYIPSSHWHNLKECRVIELRPEAQTTLFAYGGSIFTVIVNTEKDMEVLKEFMSTKAPEHKVKYAFAGVYYEIVAKTKEDLDHFNEWWGKVYKDKGQVGDPYDAIAAKMGLTEMKGSLMDKDVWRDKNQAWYKKDEFGFHKI